MNDAKALAAQNWFGYGRWDAQYWFIGMEPGGDDEHSSYEAWLQLDPQCTGLIDCYAHHMDTEHPAWQRWHSGDVPPIQRTWGPLITAMLAFENRPASYKDVSRFQRDEWGRTTGATAIIELSALHAKNLGVEVERTLHRAARIERIKREMEIHNPRFAIFYGTSYRSEYEKIAGTFGAQGWTWKNSTMCVIVQHPAYRFAPRGEYWIELGSWLREAVSRGPTSELPAMPETPQINRYSRNVKGHAAPVSSSNADENEFTIERDGFIVGRVLYDGWNLRVEHRNKLGGFELVGYYERARPTTVHRKIMEISDVFDDWSKHQSVDYERVRVNWRTAPFVDNFNPPPNAIDLGCSIVEDDGIEVGRIYKVRPHNAVWRSAGE